MHVRPHPAITRPTERRTPERGTTLLLFPAAVMVLLALGSIAADLSLVHLARRELLRSASQAADDAAAMIDRDEFRRSGTLRLDPVRARRVVEFDLAVARLPGHLVGAPRVTIDADRRTVTVAVTMEVQRIFAGAVPGTAEPGGTGRSTVSVEARGRLVDRP